MTIDAARLRALAEAARDACAAREAVARDCTASQEAYYRATEAWMHARRDLERAASPDAILALLDERDALVRERDAVLAANRDCLLHFDALKAERDALAAMLRRIRAWDMLDVAGDGAYWKREIDAALDGAKEPT